MLNVRFPVEASVGTVIDFDRIISTVSHEGQDRRRDPQRIEVLAIPLAEVLSEERSLPPARPLFVVLERTELAELQKFQGPAGVPRVKDFCRHEFEKVLHRFVETDHLSVALSFGGEFNLFFIKIDGPLRVKKIAKSGLVITPEELVRAADAHIGRYEKLLGQIESSPKHDADKINMIREYIGDLKRSRDDFTDEVSRLRENGKNMATVSKTNLKKAVFGSGADEIPLSQLYQALIEDLTAEGLGYAVPSEGQSG